MARTLIEKEQAAAEIAERLANRDRSQDQWRDAAPLRRIGDAFREQVVAEAKVTKAVMDARAEGFSWAAIALMLGVSKETARQRYADAADS